MKNLTRIMTLVMVGVLVTSAAVLAGNGPAGQGGGKRKGGPIMGILKNLNLSEAQKAQIQPMTRQFHEQMKAQNQAFEAKVSSCLTPQQQTRFQQLNSQSQEGGGGLPMEEKGRQLNLTPQQEKQIQPLLEEHKRLRESVFNTYVDQVKGVLSPAQRAQLETGLKQRQGGKGQGKEPGGAH